MKTKIAFKTSTLGLHESLGNFPWARYPNGLFAHVAFLTPKNELLLVPDGNGGWQLPSEKLIGSCLLVNSPVRIHDEVLGNGRYCKFDSARRAVTRVGIYEDEGAYHEVLRVHVIGPMSPEWLVVRGFPKLEALVSDTSLPYAVAEWLAGQKVDGWAKVGVEEVAVA